MKEDQCRRCGFIPEHLCQLDVDHIDGNHLNNDPENLQTLCANCHRLKTWENEDWDDTAGAVPNHQNYLFQDSTDVLSEG